jgi:hypothetical protein
VCGHTHCDHRRRSRSRPPAAAPRQQRRPLSRPTRPTLCGGACSCLSASSSGAFVGAGVALRAASASSAAAAALVA